jgi:hypothetical protein
MVCSMHKAVLAGLLCGFAALLGLSPSPSRLWSQRPCASNASRGPVALLCSAACCSPARPRASMSTGRFDSLHSSLTRARRAAGVLCSVAARGGPTTLQDSSFTNRAKYMHSEKVMRQALAKAHEYERRASAQKRLEQKDEDTHAALLRAARARAEVLHRDDVKATHVTDVRPPPPSAAPRPRARCGRGLTRGARQVRGNLERQLEATQNILALHESRLESLMSERRRDTIQAAATQRDENALSSSRDKMEASVATLQSKVASMKAGLKKEEAEAEKKGAAPALEKMLRMYTSKEHLEHSRAQRSPPRPPRARPAPAPRHVRA